MKLKPLFDKVVLEQKKQEEKTASGIVLPGNDKEMPMQGKVVAVGPGGMVDGNEVKMEVKVGEDVIYSKYSGSEIEIDKYKKFIRNDYFDSNMVPKCVWDNIWVIKKCIYILLESDGYTPTIYAGIKHGINIPYYNLTIENI